MMQLWLHHLCFIFQSYAMLPQKRNASDSLV